MKRKAMMAATLVAISLVATSAAMQAPAESQSECNTPRVVTLSAAVKAIRSRTLTFRNQNWSRGITVEVRAGNFQDCEQNRLIGTRRLARGETWQITTSEVRVCYRRDADPDHPDGRWTVWHGDENSSDHDINL